ncbi:hypothetical protein NMY22_g3051 [Coprinellus aureogranulatus]|nr:hypothetical protein NMY22_g3051 [Coprinellus aureogranulatus]
MGFSDVLALIIVISAVVYGVNVASKQINEGMASTKESLKAKGVDISASGVSMKTDKRLERQDYIDATQRGFIKTLQASSAAKVLDQPQQKHKKHHIARSLSNNSEASIGSDSSEKKRKTLFGRRKTEL